MTDPALADLIHAVAFVTFTTLLFLGSITTIARMVFYRISGFHRPRLLMRDVLVIGGMTFSFAAILFIRAADLDLRDSVVWALVTDIPAIFAAAVYVVYELFVIERASADRES